MAQGDKLSQTMRIDLIPELPSESEAGKARVVIAAPTQRHRRSLSRGAEAPSPGADAAQSQYKELLQSLYDAAFVCDMTGKIVDFNARAVDFLLYTREELLSISILDIISGADESLMQKVAANLESERFTLIQAYCVRKDRSFFPSEIAVNKLQIGKMHLCFFLRDTTVRRQEQEMLRTEHNAIQNSGNGIAIVNLSGLIEYANPAVAAMWAYSDPDELLGQDARILLSDPAAAGAMMSAVINGRQTWSGEMKARKKSQGEFDVQISAACNRNSDGEPVGIVFSFVDISDRKRAEGALQEADRQRVMLESLGAACHHLGQPATVLLANLGILQKRWNADDPALKDLVTSSIEAAELLGAILHKLNTVNQYRTMPYLERIEGSDSPENRILEITGVS
jgi:PAS domain S-box-containing protein